MAHHGQRESDSDSVLGDHFDALPLRPMLPRTLDASHVALLDQQEDQEPPDSQSSAVYEPPHSGTPQPQRSSNATRQTHLHYALLPTVDEAEETSYAPHPAEPSAGRQAKVNNSFWRPSTLRWPILLSAFIIALALGLIVIFLLVYSAVHDGLGPDDGSSAILFAWRFLPTLMTVLYAILTTMMFNDARRTEPFAQMSHVLGASSASSILKEPGQWWSLLGHSLKRHENHGTFNYYLLAIVLVNVISSLLINTLSSALLQSQPVGLISKVSFTRYETTEDHPISMAANDLVYFRTIGNILQNLTTSAWLTDKYAVVPFSPSSATVSLGTALTGKAQQWQSNTTVLSLELNCEKMNIHTSYWSKNFTGDDTTRDFHSLLLTDTHGCEAGINGYNQYLTEYGGGSWFVPPNFTVPIWDPSDTETGLWYHFYNSTQQCDSRQIILSTNDSWQGELVDTWSSSFKAEAWSCQTTYYAADIPVTASTASNGTILQIDDEAFSAGKSPLQNAILDQSRFEAAFLDKNWTSMIYTPNYSDQENFGGASAILGALYDFNPASMIGTDTVVENARRIKQRFLGEMILATVANNNLISQSGQVTDTQRRIVVNLPVAISVAVLFIISAALIALVLLLSTARPLNLYHDPASVAAVVELIDGNTVIRDSSKILNPDKTGGIYEALEHTQHFLADGSLSSVKSVVAREGMCAQSYQKVS